MSIARSIELVQQQLAAAKVATDAIFAARNGDQSGLLHAALDLTAAIAGAQKALEFVEAEMAEPVEVGGFDFLADRERERQDAMADAVSSHWGID